MHLFDALDVFDDKPRFTGFMASTMFDRNGPPEEAAIKGAQYPAPYPQELVADMRSILSRKEFPWEAIKTLANYNDIKTEEDTRIWLEKMIDIIETHSSPKPRSNELPSPFQKFLGYFGTETEKDSH